MQAVILAAGESSRFYPFNLVHKSLMKIMGKTLIEWTIESLRENGINDIIVVESPKRDVEKEIRMKNIEFVIQPEPKGMGNAVLQVENVIKDYFFVVNAYHFDAGEFCKLMEKKREETGADVVLLVKEVEQPWKHGIIIVDENVSDKAIDIVEQPERGKEPSNLGVKGIYLLPPSFFEYYKRIPEHMYAFEDTLRIFMKEGDVRIVKTEREVLSLKYPWELLNTAKVLLQKRIKGQIIAESAKIGRNVTIEGDVYIGENTQIFENAVIKGPCYIGNNCVIGNNAIIRENVNIEDNCIIGANCEVARSVIQEGTHTHSGFIADSIIGKNCRIGAGFITANVKMDRGEIKAVVKGKETLTGLKRLGVIMGDNTKTGVGVKTMPGVIIGNNCAIGPGTIVFDNVEDNTTFYFKFDNFVKKKRE